jgi:hypothetical protein
MHGTGDLAGSQYLRSKTATIKATINCMDHKRRFNLLQTCRVLKLRYHQLISDLVIESAYEFSLFVTDYGNAPCHL